ncbi:MAG TPA: PA2169 family four-helix-bundle protein [Burkholderiaceae bacterium]|jgi:uncharacterized protein (TIGR02284 family)|nr:PA2169 family four-helix-bundle protein [Burkholderiaceae bacterium]
MNNEDIVEVLNDLIETSKDGEYGFRTSAEYLKAADTRALFERRAEECRQAAADLQQLVRQYGGKAEDGGSASGAMHRGWVAVKGTLSGYSDKAILEETERGEDVALASYRKALDKSLPAEVRALIERQCEGVKHNHAQVRFLRDQARAASV